MSFDAWKTASPTDCMPSTDAEQCDRCREPYAWVTDAGERLCETHCDAVTLEPRDEHRRDEGDEAMGEERAERIRDWYDNFDRCF